MSTPIVSTALTAKTFGDLPAVIQTAVLRHHTKDDFIEEFFKSNSAQRDVLLDTLKDFSILRYTTDKQFATLLVINTRYGRATDSSSREVSDILSKLYRETCDEIDRRQEEQEERDAEKKKKWIEEYKKTHQPQIQPKPATTSVITKGLLREVINEFLPRRRPVPTTDKYRCDVCQLTLSSHGALFNHKKSKVHLKMIEKSSVEVPTSSV